MKVGFARVDITPEEFGPMGGHGNDERRICREICDPVFGSCIAITDEAGNTVLFLPCDLIHAHEAGATPARQAVSEATGVPFDQIMICASHTHSGPSMSRPHLEAVQKYYRYLAKKLVEAATLAMADRKPATVEIGQKQVPGMTFVRHYIMNDGTVAGPNSGSFASGVKAHLTDPDEQLQLVRFCREGGKDVLLVNWQCHVTIGEQGTSSRIMTADYPGVMRNLVEEKLGCHCAFFQGAAGNLVPSSRIEGEAKVEHERVAYGTALAEHVVDCAKVMHPVNTGAVKVEKRTYTGLVDHSEDHRIEDAKEVTEHWMEYPTYAQQLEYSRSKGFNSMHHARGVLSRAELGESISIDVYAIAMGDVAFITAPYEMFCSSGMFIKKNSPYKQTMICSCSNHTNDYLADRVGFQYDIYEVNTRRMGAGTAEALAELYVTTLTEIKNR